MQVLFAPNNNTSSYSVVESRENKMNRSHFNRFRDTRFQSKCEFAAEIIDAKERLSFLHINMSAESDRLETIQTVLSQHEYNLRNLSMDEDIEFVNTMIEILQVYKDIELECKGRVVYWQTLINDAAVKDEKLAEFYKNPVF